MFLITRLMVCLSFFYLTSGCASIRNQQGAAIGTAGGGALGAMIGKAAGNSGLGAIMGANVGGVTGSVIGKKMDNQADEIKSGVQGVKVDRVGEGILVEFKSKILFGAGQAELTGASQKNINELAKVLNKYSDTNIEIQGHTDNRGNDQYNQTLSERRAKAVASYLVTKGIVLERMTVKGFGETSPKYSNNSESGRAENRRVEFLISANEKMKQDALKESGN